MPFTSRNWRVISSPVLPRCWVVIALALQVLDLVDAGVGQHDELEVLRIERRDVADVVVRLVERRLAGRCASTVEIELPKPMSALPSSMPRTLAMPAPGSDCTVGPGIAFSQMSLSWPPSGIQKPPCGPVIILSVGGRGRRGERDCAKPRAESERLSCEVMAFLSSVGRPLRPALSFDPGDVDRPGLTQGYAASRPLHKAQIGSAARRLRPAAVNRP